MEPPSGPPVGNKVGMFSSWYELELVIGGVSVRVPRDANCAGLTFGTRARDLAMAAVSIPESDSPASHPQKASALISEAVNAAR